MQSCSHDGGGDKEQPCCMNADRREGSGGTADKWQLSLQLRAVSTAVRGGVYPELASPVDNNLENHSLVSFNLNTSEAAPRATLN